MDDWVWVWVGAIAFFAVLELQFVKHRIEKHVVPLREEALAGMTRNAARALGMTRLQVARHITLPLMFRIALPSLGNTFVALFKDTSLASAIAVPELTYGAIRINVNTWRVIEVYLVVGLIYLAACYAIAGSLRQLERRFAVVT